VKSRKYIFQHRFNDFGRKYILPVTLASLQLSSGYWAIDYCDLRVLSSFFQLLIHTEQTKSKSLSLKLSTQNRASLNFFEHLKFSMLLFCCSRSPLENKGRKRTRKRETVWVSLTRARRKERHLRAHNRWSGGFKSPNRPRENRCTKQLVCILDLRINEWRSQLFWAILKQERKSLI